MIFNKENDNVNKKSGCLFAALILISHLIPQLYKIYYYTKFDEESVNLGCHLDVEMTSNPLLYTIKIPIFRIAPVQKWIALMKSPRKTDSENCMVCYVSVKTFRDTMMFIIYET